MNVLKLNVEKFRLNDLAKQVKFASVLFDDEQKNFVVLCQETRTRKPNANAEITRTFFVLRSKFKDKTEMTDFFPLKTIKLINQETNFAIEVVFNQ
jgi:hypothetical protein